MANEVPAAVVLDNDLREQAAQNTLAANPLVGRPARGYSRFGTSVVRANAE